jgi:hypothetical protein
MQSGRGNDQKSSTLSFLVDVASVAADPELPYLLSFDGVEGISVEQNVVLVERPGQESKAILRADGSLHVSLAPFNQFKRFAADIAARPNCNVKADVVERALAYSFLADRLGIDGVVTSARPVFGLSDSGLLDLGSLVTVGEALAMIGANVRQRETVPLGGFPLFTQERTEVYPLTARVVIPRGQEWWSSCLASASSPQADLVSHGQAVFRRAGQALRGRDGVHEALRLRQGRAAILDALYHFDVVLASSVASLDALARVANEVFQIFSPNMNVGWQRKDWRKELTRSAPLVAAVVDPTTRLGAALLVLTTLRNSLHSIPLDEYLQVVVKHQADLVEHRVMVPRELALRLRDVAGPLGPLDQSGIFVDDVGTSFVNIPQLTEQLLSWTIEIIGELFSAMISCSQFVPGIQADFAPIEEHERELCAKLARVGVYPSRMLSKGLPASPSVRRTVLASIYAHLPNR